MGKSAILTQALLDFKDYVKRVKRNVIALTCVVGSPDLKAIFPRGRAALTILRPCFSCYCKLT